MAVLVNFKICDNAKECGGIAACPTGALSWNEQKETIEIDNSKCISCGLCEKECPIGAIMVAKKEEDYKKMKEEIDNNKRTTKDLFVDRYGAAGTSEFFQISSEVIKEKGEKNCLTLVEVYNPEEAECLLKSISIKKLTGNFPKDTLYYKAESDNTIKDFDIKELPALLVLKNGNLLGENRRLLYYGRKRRNYFKIKWYYSK